MRRFPHPPAGHGCGIRLTARRHVDLLRVSSAACISPR